MFLGQLVYNIILEIFVTGSACKSIANLCILFPALLESLLVKKPIARKMTGPFLGD